MRRYLFVFLLALTSLQCAKPEPEYLGPVFGDGPKRIVVISLDSLRADHLSCYGYETSTSPKMDALCGQSVRFARASAPYNWTLPSHCSLFTGLYTRGHGVRRANQIVPEEIPSLVEPLQKAGFATAAFTGGAVMAKTYGHDRGFDDFRASEKDYDQWSEILERGENWLSDHSTEDVFLFLHTYEIHMPYVPPVKYLSEILGYESTEFTGEVSEVPKYLTGAPPKIVTSDHGEAFWEQGRWGHNGELLGPQLTDVPLIVRMPRTVFPDFTGKVDESEVSFLDIMPTVLDAVGVEPESDIDGFSLLPELIGRPVNTADAEARARRTVMIDGDERLLGLCESRNYVSLRSGGWSVVVPGPTHRGDDWLDEDLPYHAGLDL